MSEHIFRTRINHTIVELHQGDITQQDVDAIVNAANSSLLGGGGVDGAIHRAAGPELLDATRKLGGCETGDARITPGFRLPARHVIHAVGPIYGKPDAAEKLASAYRRSLEVALENELETIAFPAISTGVYGYPMDEAAHISLTTVCDIVAAQAEIQQVRFVLFTSDAADAYRRALKELAKRRDDLDILTD